MKVGTVGNDSAFEPLRFDSEGLIPVVAQDDESGEVLLLAFMNAEALQLTLDERTLVLWSRSRSRLWRKGEQSGHRLRLCELRLNCESNSLLARVRLEGPGACHQGYRSCFYRSIQALADGALDVRIVEERVFDPGAVYLEADDTETTMRNVAPESERDAPAAFEQEMRSLYQAYERLRDGNVAAASPTAVLLKAADQESISRWAVLRGQQELAELRGVISGSHQHHGGDEDVILEAGQVSYWAIVATVAARAKFDDWRPDEAWLAGNDGREMGRSFGSAVLAECTELMRATGAACRAARVHPRQVVAADLAAMRTKHPKLFGSSPRRGEVT